MTSDEKKLFGDAAKVLKETVGKYSKAYRVLQDIAVFYGYDIEFNNEILECEEREGKKK